MLLEHAVPVKTPHSPATSSLAVRAVEVLGELALFSDGPHHPTGHPGPLGGAAHIDLAVAGIQRKASRSTLVHRWPVHVGYYPGVLVQFVTAPHLLQSTGSSETYS